MGESEGLLAGVSFPWQYLDGVYMRLERFTPFSVLNGDDVAGPRIMGAYGLALVELPNPDVQPHERMVTLPLKHKSDYKSVYRAHLDRGVKDSVNELILLHEHRTGLFAGSKPSLHVAAFPKGTWHGFFKAVARYEAREFPWPDALFLYQPTNTPAFTSRNMVFRP